jgi:hypothetical protein
VVILDEPTAALGVRESGLGHRPGVITPQSHTMEEAVAIMTGATTLDGAAEDSKSAAAREASERTETTGTG